MQKIFGENDSAEKLVTNETYKEKRIPLACTINIYNRRFYDRNDIGLYYNTLEMIVIDDPSLS
jgi:hypothetical protein